ncbi:AAA family ATPase [Bordetella genomosp. 11]|uniref:Aminoglycoside phosphotransferase n=1 Tax=Bordetella genomosp. 11 TaxID=1416808 RepID=A0A261UG68_9BORD|nr:bifunctional aminoglycoside phosphotransferase/ATP-binding protein [Bordetella genomosp. 11]OZI60601.1 aminoglycoside phosphotransferase [Bordetella genomosp. 11]
MEPDTQSATMDFLGCPRTHGETAEIATVQTHISVIFLTSHRAFKLKRAVRYPYVDFSTPALRLAACRRELELNRRTAPMLYLAVRRITRQPDGSLAFDGPGELVDAVVEMARFDEETLFDRMATRGALTAPLMTRLAHAIAAFHQDAPVARHARGSAIMRRVLDINELAFLTLGSAVPAGCTVLNRLFRLRQQDCAALLDARGRAGRIRHCHGDLHLRNICLVDGMPVLFDCLEFDEALATVDVLYDLAFLLMDLRYRGQPQWANFVFNRYLEERDETDGLPLMPYFLALRSAIRCHVIAAQARDAHAPRRRDLLGEARDYGQLALRLLQARPARLIAIGGLSGTGKSTLAAAIAHRIGQAPGARVLSSDRIRKRLYGVAANARLPPEAYRPAVSEQVYATLARQALDTLARGHAVIADAAFERPEDRESLRQVAARAGVPFDGLWLEAALDLRLARVDRRRHDPSDADAEVLMMQMRKNRGAPSWRTVQAGGDPDAISESVAAMLRLDQAS